MTTIERLRELEEKATAGPWTCWSHVGATRLNSLCRPDGVFPLACQGVVIGGVNATSTGSADSELIAAMRNALPALLRVAEAAADYARYEDLTELPCEACCPPEPAALIAARAELHNALAELEG